MSARGPDVDCATCEGRHPRGMCKGPKRGPNQFERHGRAVKVGKLLAVADKVIALMPAGTDDVEAAKRFRRFRQEDRARVALLAGVNVPSDATWAAFCEAVATRTVLRALDDDAPIT